METPESSALSIEQERLMAFVSLQWRNAVVHRSRRSYQDLVTALAVAHRRAGAALSQVFRGSGLEGAQRRSLLRAHGDLDAAMDEVSRHLVGTPRWWREADTLVRRIADGLLLAVEMCEEDDDGADWFEEQTTAIFARPDLEVRQTLPL